jgi:sugar phosphate isomerase/epimerase
MRLLSLAAGVLPEFAPEQVAQAAVESGFEAVGFTVVPETWTDTTTARVQAILQPAGVGVLDVEVIWIGADGRVTDGHRKILDVGGALGAKNALIVSSCTDDAKNCDAFAILAEHASQHNIRACLEFLRITAVTHLSQALRIIETVGHPAGGILVDTIHLARCREFHLLRSVDPRWLPYSQFCDGNVDCAEDYQSLLTDAVDLRSLPGEGGLPLQDVLSVLRADLPLALEIRSRQLREEFPNHVARARHVLTRARAYFDQ